MSPAFHLVGSLGRPIGEDFPHSTTLRVLPLRRKVKRNRQSQCVNQSTKSYLISNLLKKKENKNLELNIEFKIVNICCMQYKQKTSITNTVFKNAFSFTNLRRQKRKMENHSSTNRRRKSVKMQNFTLSVSNLWSWKHNNYCKNLKWRKEYPQRISPNTFSRKLDRQSKLSGHYPSFGERNFWRNLRSPLYFNKWGKRRPNFSLLLKMLQKKQGF